MRRCWSVVLLGLGAVCFALFWIPDVVASAVGRALLRNMLEGRFEGDCPEENQAFRRFVRSLPYPFHTLGLNFTISEGLHGLRLVVLVKPYSLEDKDDQPKYIEEGVWALQVEVEDETMWVMHDREHSTMTVEQPFYNVNLLTAVLAPMMVDAISEGNFPVGFPVPPASFENKSIIDRVQRALNITDAIKEAVNNTEETNSLREFHEFLSLGGSAALAYRNSHIELGKRQISPIPNALWSMAPLLRKRTHAYFPGFKDVSFEYWRSSHSDVTGLYVDMHRAKDIWEPSNLCQLTSRAFLNMYEKLAKYRLHMTSPGKIQSENYIIMPSVSPYSVTLEVYRPFATPIGGTATVQMDYLIPNNASFGKLQGELTPVMQVEVKIEKLPDTARYWLVVAVIIRTVLLLLFIILSCFFFVVGLTLWAIAMHDRRRGRRQERRYRTRTLDHTPL